MRVIFNIFETPIEFGLATRNARTHIRLIYRCICSYITMLNCGADKMGRIQTGIAGFDDLIGGGFPDGSINIVSGPAGAAKSLFALHFIINGASKFGENGVYFTVEESAESIIKTARIFGFEIDRLIEEKKVFIIDLGRMKEDAQPEITETGERKDLVNFDTIKNFLTNFITNANIKRVVLDSINGVAISYRTSEQLRAEIFRFMRFLRAKGVTSVIISESLSKSGEDTKSGIETFIGDSIIAMGFEKFEGEYRRTITVLKMRHTRHDTATHPFLIGESGIEVASEMNL
jgi:circadian clock protein KaiC